MKRIILFFLLTCFTVTSYAAEKNLYKMFKGRPDIKVYLKDVTSDTKDPKVSTGVFEKVFKDVLPERLNIEFIPVDNANQADVVVRARIKSYLFKEKVAPRFFSLAALAADTTAPKSLARLVVDYDITSPEGEKVLLSFKNFTTEERRPTKDMAGEGGFIHAANKNINRFIYRFSIFRMNRIQERIILWIIFLWS